MIFLGGGHTPTLAQKAVPRQQTVEIDGLWGQGIGDELYTHCLLNPLYCTTVEGKSSRGDLMFF